VVTRIASSLLYGVSASDSTTYLAIAAALSAVGLVAIVLPALRATRADSMRALRAEWPLDLHPILGGRRPEATWSDDLQPDPGGGGGGSPGRR
jgi:hypothetical protein